MIVASNLPAFLRNASIALLCLLFIAAGINHFVSPGIYLSITPAYLPWPLALVYVSGFFEVLGGLGVAVPRLRQAAGYGLIALLIALFPANVDMVLNANAFRSIPYWLLVARLPLQGILIAWVWWTAVKGRISQDQLGKLCERPAAGVVADHDGGSGHSDRRHDRDA